VIQRRWTFRQGGRVRDLDSADGEEVLVEANHRKKIYGTWQEANSRIEELIFPCNVMPCLFFDGEQAQARVEAAGAVLSLTQSRLSMAPGYLSSSQRACEPISLMKGTR